MSCEAEYIHINSQAKRVKGKEIINGYIYIYIYIFEKSNGIVLVQRKVVRCVRKRNGVEF